MAGVSLPAALLAAQVAQLGFEAKLLGRLNRVETKVEERTDPVTTRDLGSDRAD